MALVPHPALDALSERLMRDFGDLDLRGMMYAGEIDGYGWRF